MVHFLDTTCSIHLSHRSNGSKIPFATSHLVVPAPSTPRQLEAWWTTFQPFAPQKKYGCFDGLYISSKISINSFSRSFKHIPSVNMCFQNYIHPHEIHHEIRRCLDRHRVRAQNGTSSSTRTLIRSY